MRDSPAALRLLGAASAEMERPADFAAKTFARSGKLLITRGTETVEQVKSDLRIEDGRAHGLKRQQLAGLLFEFFDSLAADFRNGLQCRQRQVFRSEFC